MLSDINYFKDTLSSIQGSGNTPEVLWENMNAMPVEEPEPVKEEEPKEDEKEEPKEDAKEDVKENDKEDDETENEKQIKADKKLSIIEDKNEQTEQKAEIKDSLVKESDQSNEQLTLGKTLGNSKDEKSNVGSNALDNEGSTKMPEREIKNQPKNDLEIDKDHGNSEEKPNGQLIDTSKDDKAEAEI